MEAIEQFEIVEDTILVFTLDHGEMFGSHGKRTRHNVDDPISNKFCPSLQEQKAIT